MTDDQASSERRLVADPCDAIALQHLAVIACRSGDGLRALHYFRRGYRLHADHTVWSTQIEFALPAAIRQAAAWLNEDRMKAASAALSWLDGLVPGQADIRRMLTTVRLIENRDADAAALHASLPEKGDGLGRAMEAVAAHRRDRDVLGTVVIPAFAAAATIARALDSVLAAIDHFRIVARRPGARISICVIDDGSPDDTGRIVRDWSAAHPGQRLTLITFDCNRGAGAARNAGVASATGALLWFLDADDAFGQRHILRTVTALENAPDAAFARTGIVFDALDDTVTAEWRSASERTFPGNLCVRRICHDLTGGFPDEEPFTPAVAEDVGYSRVLHGLFEGVGLGERTVRYTMREGNTFSKLKDAMTGGPPPAASDDTRWAAIEILIRRRIHAAVSGRPVRWNGPPFQPVDASRLAAVPPPDPADTFARSMIGDGGGEPPVCELAALWARRGEVSRATGLLRKAISVAPDDTRLALALARIAAADRPTEAVAALKEALARRPACGEAWFELGVAFERMQRSEGAVAAFRRAARLLPHLAAPPSNAAILLMERGARHLLEALLRAALVAQPDHPNALLQAARLAQREGRLDRARVLIDRALRVEAGRPDLLAERASILLSSGDAPAAALAARAAVAAAPGAYEGHAVLAGVLEALGRPAEALAAWDAAIAANPGFGDAFTRRALLLLASRLGPPPPPRARGAAGARLSVSRLGRDGRFGNQLLQYGFARLHADRNGLVLETPPWVGRHLFNLDDPLPGPALPRLHEAEADLAGDRSGRYAGRDLVGYFCGDTGAWAVERDHFRQLFTPAAGVQAILSPALDALRARGRTLVAIHLRRGDFGWGRFWIAPEQWYLRWLHGLWADLDDPVLYVASDAPEIAEAFAAFGPITARAFGTPLPGAEFLVDFHLLRHADRLATSNSSFSGVAAMLNASGRCVRPSRRDACLVPYDPWCSPVLT